MRQEDAAFGGEPSGHFYFRDNWYADSGIAALLNALEMISEAGKPLSEVIAPLDHRFRSGEINSEVADPAAVMRPTREPLPSGGRQRSICSTASPSSFPDLVVQRATVQHPAAPPPERRGG